METDLQNDVNALITRVNGFVIVNSQTYRLAGELWTRAREIRAKIAESFDPIIDKAHKAHKEAVAQKNKLDDPLQRAQRVCKSKMIGYDQEQEQKRRAEQLRQEAEARKKAEEEALEVASLMDQAGLKEEAEQMLSEPVEVPPVVVEKLTPRVEGFSYRSNWKAEVVDRGEFLQGIVSGKIPDGAWQVNEKLLGEMARALKMNLDWPGVKVWEEKV